MMNKTTRRQCIAMLGALGLGMVPVSAAMGQIPCGCAQEPEPILYAFGDSITQGFLASDLATKAYAPLVAAGLGVGINNRAVGGSRMGDGVPPRTPNIHDAMMGATPPLRHDVVVMICGTNDGLVYGTDADHLVFFQAKLKEALLWITSHRRTPEARTVRDKLLLRQGKLTSVDDGCSVWVGNTPGQAPGAYEDASSPASDAAYCAAIASVVADVAAQGRRVHLVDINAIYDPATMSDEGGPTGPHLHPNDAGHAAIAAAFLAAIHT